MRIRDVYPGSRTSDPVSRIQKQQQNIGLKKVCCRIFFCCHKNHKIENFINFELVKKKFWANLQRIIEFSPQNTVIKLSKISIWDPGSWSRSQKGTGSRIQIRKTDGYHNTQNYPLEKCKKAKCLNINKEGKFILEFVYSFAKDGIRISK